MAADLALADTADVDLTETAVGHLVRWARTEPDRVAVVDQGDELSYATIAVRVAAVRAALVAAGCGAGDVVACIGERGVTTMTLFLALESLGAVYLPLDLGWPSARLAEALRRSRAATVVDYLPAESAARDKVRAAAITTGVPILTSPPLTDVSAGTDLADLLTGIDRAHVDSAEEPRYLYYTSGTTGAPKGALTEHRGMVNHLRAKILDLDLRGDDRIAFTAPLMFDIAICQMLMPVLVGGVVVVVDDVRLRIPRWFVRELATRAVTVVELVPTLVRWVTDEVERSKTTLPNLRWVVSTGEELRPALARRVFEFLPQAQLLNSYGFTETSDDVAHHRVRPQDLDGIRVPVGSPVINSTLYVLVNGDEGWRPAAHGEPGELFVGGIPVGRGYPDDAAATRKSFIEDVLDPASPTGRLYRTGDLAMIENGVLYCLGRLDRQTKIAGVRVEPDEVEAVLLGHPAIAQCAVVVRAADHETREIVAFYRTTEDVTIDDLRHHVAAALPPQMVPQAWVAVEHLPLSANGKVDYRNLTTILSD